MRKHKLHSHPNMERELGVPVGHIIIDGDEYFLALNRESENKKLRELLWLHHGCSISILYGDDGKM